MKQNTRLFGLQAILVLLAVTLFSFSAKKGGDSFEVWLNGKRVIQQFVHVSKGVQTLHLDKVSENDRMDIYYSHCGQTGKNRYITIKDERNRPVKVWKFNDATENNLAMSFKLKDLLGIKKNKNDKLSLFYSSSQLPDGRLLTIIDSNETGIARK